LLEYDFAPIRFVKLDTGPESIPTLAAMQASQKHFPADWRNHSSTRPATVGFNADAPMLAYAGPNCGGVSLSNLELCLGHATRSFSTAKFSHASAIFKSWVRCCSFFTLRARARHSDACFL